MRKIVYLGLNLGTSFSSLFMALLITKEVSQMSGKENLFQALGLTLYLAGLGIGSLFASKKTDEKFSIKVVLLTELGNFFSGALSLLFLFTHLTYSTATILNAPVSPQDIPLAPLIIWSLLGTVSLGVFTGAQLPNFLKKYSNEKNMLLFMNYSGALIAGLFLNHLLKLSIPLSQCLNIFLLLSLFNMISCLFFIEHERRTIVLLLLPPLLAFPFIPNLTKRAKDSFLISYYQGIKAEGLSQLWELPSTGKKLGNVLSYSSPYQEIHILSEKPVQNGAALGNISLYINYRPQFDIYSNATYHESMLYGSLNLSNQNTNSPKDVLVLGGGDGILLNLIDRELPNSQLTLVELDPMMINLFSNNSLLTHFNKYVLKKRESNIIIEDGLHYLKQEIKSERKYDAIFIDFPYPYSDELTSLYSIEFYSIIKKALKPEAFFVLDFPIIGKANKESLLYSKLKKTLSDVGFKTIFPYGPYSSFVFVQHKDRHKEIDFDYSSIKPNLHLSTYLNLVGLKHLKTNKEVSPFSLFYEN
jgi:spermidine synthase